MTTVSGTSATVTGLAADTSYTFTVKAKDAAGNVSAASSALTVKTEVGTTNPGVSAWQANTAYVVGQLVTYNGKTYKCLQSHTSLTGWEPSNVAALWQLQT